MNMSNWGLREQLEAHAMGWDIFQCDRGERTFEIERIDEAEQLESDIHAELFVMLGADAGIPVCVIAVNILRKEEPEYVNMLQKNVERACKATHDDQLEGGDPSSDRIELKKIERGTQAGWWYYSIDGAHNDYTFYHRGPCVRAAEEALSALSTDGVPVEDGNGIPYVLHGCECDNTHEQNGTVCRWCMAKMKPAHHDKES